MAATFKSLLVVLVLAMMAFALVGRPVCSIAMQPADYLRRRNLWIGITIAVFVANNFWMYILIVALLLAFAVKKEKNYLALYFFVLFAVPMISKEMGGVGPIQSLFAMDYARLLALVILLPAFNLLRRAPDRVPLGRLGIDKMLFALLLTQFLLIAQDTSITNALRAGIFYPFLGMFLPYFVASRLLRTFEGFREAMTAYVIAAMVLSTIVFFEFLKHWLLYTQLELSLGVDWRISRLLQREGSLRAIGSTGQPIAAGFAITVAIGFHIYLRPLMPKRQIWAIGMALLLAGLIATLSRGPWVGAVVLLLVLLMTSSNPMKQMMKAGGVGIMLLLIIVLSPGGDKLVAYLPWVGSVEAGNVDYRENLLEKAWVVLMKNPLLGDRNFIANASEMKDLALGSGFIDVVNTYVRVALSYGLTGLTFFGGCFVAVIVGTFTTMRRIRNKDDEGYRLGQVLLSVLVSIAIMIGTVSSITVIPYIYWSVLGMGAGYILTIRRIRQRDAQEVMPDSLMPASQAK